MKVARNSVVTLTPEQVEYGVREAEGVMYDIKKTHRNTPASSYKGYHGAHLENALARLAWATLTDGPDPFEEIPTEIGHYYKPFVTEEGHSIVIRSTTRPDGNLILREDVYKAMQRPLEDYIAFFVSYPDEYRFKYVGSFDTKALVHPKNLTNRGFGPIYLVPQSRLYEV